MSSFQDIAAKIAHYTQTPRISVRHCQALAIQLERVAPSVLRPDEREALRVLVLRASEVEALAAKRERSAPPAVREPRNQLSIRWTAFYAGLQSIATLPAEISADGSAAARLAQSLFPEGTSFVSSDAHALYIHSKRLFDRIEAEGLAGPLDALLHPGLLRAVRRAHTELGLATGLGEGSEVSLNAASLVEARGRFVFAVSSYARALSVGIDDRDHEAADRFVRAMSPVDTYRITTGKTDGEGDDEGTDPVTPGDSGPGGPTPPPFG
ncbi:MAG: hypothetical protein J0L92_19490 [Deltaproteobacteria bacterium]|nr:hypothetical protein [Deltaproteobacteria bacterium]